MNIVLFKKHVKLSTIILFLALAIAVVYGLGAFVNLRTQYIEYKEIGENFLGVFWTNLNVQIITFGISAFVIFLSILFTNICIQKSLKKMCENEKAMYIKTPNKSLALLVAIIGGLGFAANTKDTILSYLNATWFNISDPIFGKNIGYFIFQRPMYLLLIESLSTLMIGLIVYTVAYYLVAISIMITNGISKENFKSSSFITHLFVNVVIFLIIRAIGVSLNIEGLVFSEFMKEDLLGKKISLVGAGFTDINISRYFYMVLPYVIIVCIILATVYLRRKNYKRMFISVAVIPAVLILHGIVTFAVNVFYVAPNELETEREYIGYNIEYTKQGYNLDVENKKYEVKNDFTTTDLENNKELVNNVRILDYKSTLKVLNQYQTIKGYYTFNDVDIAVYDVDNVKNAVFIAARELNADQLKDKNYIAKRFQYTHGYGLVVTPVNSVDKNGYPNYIVKDITSDLSNSGINIVEPRIYFGELTNEHVVVNGNNIKEFDYPKDDENVQEYEYTGNAGIKMTLGNRILMALKYLDSKLIYSQYIDNDSKLLVNRDIIERAKKIAPFFEYDNDPYLVVNGEGKLIWVIDAYTTTPYYPYSQMSEIEKHYPNGIPYVKEFNYIRNSVKVTIDAYDGTTKFYITDRDDPLVMSYYKMYPSMFENIDEGLSEDIWQHIRYPEYLYNIQSEKLLQYHVDSVDTFYRNEDVWAVTTHNNGTKEEVMAPYYGLTNINGQLQFALMQQYTPLNRSNLVAWTAVGSNKENYGKIIVNTFNEDTNVVGPMQLDNQIDQNADISKDLSLWNSGGSSITRSMTIVPVNNILIYVEPIYLAAINESQIPSIKKVVVSNGVDLAMATTFEEALAKLINEDTIQITVENTDTVKDIVDNLITTNRNLKQAANEANWEQYGKYMQKIDDLIKQLEDMEKSKE